ncbi:Serine/threonine-protein kinase par-4 [Rhypophila decipiens]
MTVSNYPDRSDEYFPERTYELLTPEAIRRHWEGESAVDHSLLQFIVEDGKRLFTLVLTTNTGSKDRQVKLMRCFQKHRISDSSLSPEIKLGRRTNPWLQPDQLRSLDENVWSFNVASTVCRQQWQVLTPVFSIEKASHDLSSQAILPFEKVKGKVPAQGAFGIVHEVKIQEGHFLGETITGGTSGKYEWPATFAVKEIKTNEQVRDELEETFTNEARHLQMMNSHYSDHIVRFVTAFTTMGGDDIGTRKYYLVFEWADGGNLQDLFKQHPNPTLSKHLIKSVVKQIHGLASALQLTHEKAMIRHGDLKPGNILRFKKSPPGSSSPVSGDGGEEDEEDIIGTLKIGDWGLAKYHAVATELRGNATKTVHGTAMYEPPEVDPDLHLGVGDNKRLGRSYDTWSMGCIILEIIIWLIYGYDGVVDFESDVRSHKATVSIPCYVVEVVKGSDPPRYQAKVRPIVNSWINHLLKEELCGANQALGQLLRIVQQDLLVVDLPRPTPQERNNPHDLDTDGIPGIRITRTATFRTGDLYSANTTTTTATRATSTQLVGKLRNVMDSQGSNPHSDWWYQPRARLDDIWEMHIDNSFAREVLSDIQQWSKNNRQEATTRLCAKCKEFDFFNTTGFSIEYDPDELSLRALQKKCGLCKLFWRAAQRYGMADRGVRLRFSKAQSCLRMDGVEFPVLTICTGLDSVSHPSIQLGLPELPAPGSDAQISIIRQWLHLCDKKSVHPNCHAESSFSSCRKGSLPTRLLDVGHQAGASVKLWETKDRDRSSTTAPVEYIALSHPWGNGPHFVTNIDNYEKHRRKIRIHSLPATFRDAVKLTRALGKRYLWIDSICIIQGPGGDFEREAKSMEAVFSSAYCVIAASRAENQRSGFLGSRPRQSRRQYVTLYESTQDSTGTKTRRPFYICENIDDFQGHVLNSHLNKRGWVLQEHALARRTIFFTDQQIYWECGDGVRCETLTKMSNNLAAFLGDPSFPRIIMNASQGEKIIRLQNLFKTYSSLGFTNPADRPVAVSGIQTRLLRAFATQGGFGIFGQDEDDDHDNYGDINNAGQKGLLRRSLLWVRANGTGLEKIIFPRGLEVPSWSWMGYTGEIDFLRPAFGALEWMKLRSPWPGRERRRYRLDVEESGDIDDQGNRDVRRAVGGKRPVIRGRIRKILGAQVTDESGRLVLDSMVHPKTQAQQGTECLVLGVEKEAVGGDRRHYLILLEPVGEEQSGVYRRIGAGYLPGKCISEEEHDGQVV